MFYTEDTAINKLLDRGVITKWEGWRGHYRVIDRPQNIAFTRFQILSRFCNERLVDGCTWKYELKEEEISQALARVAQEATLRRLSIYGYHGAARNFQAAINLVPFDADGVRRTFGVEYEIYSLTREQEDKLARLLDNMPSHIVERDGSLDRDSGVEIIFDPVGEETYKFIVKTMRQFVEENHIEMERGDRHAGMHTTYGVSNYEASLSDLQIRLNRFALAVKSVGTQSQIIKLFGRDFGDYRELPRSTTTNIHSNAFSVNGRSQKCWECRLPNWKCDPDKMVEFFKITEVVFHRPVTGEDFMAIFNLLGGEAHEA